MVGVSVRTARQQRNAPWLSLLLALALMMSMSPVAFAQDQEAEPLSLGQLATRTMADGESALYTFDAPEETLYVITTGDEEEAAKFDLIITDDRGEVVYDDVFGTIELDLDNREHTLELIATEDATLSLFVTAQIGDMTDDSSRSGDLEAGGFYTEENVDDYRYAELRIPRTDYWQRVFINVSGNEGDSYSATVTGDNVWSSISDSAVEGPLTFWSNGGRYDVTVSPYSGGESMTVVILMSGPVPQVPVGVPVDATFSAGSKDTAWQFDLPEGGRAATVRLTSDSDFDLDMAVSVNPTTDTWTSYNSGTDETINFVAPQAGTYYIRIFTGTPPDDPIDYTLSVEQGEEAAALTPGVREWDTLEPGGIKLYSLPVDKPDQLVTIQLASSTDGDIDMRAQQIDENGYASVSMSSSNSGSIEMMSQPVSTPGVFEVTVDGRYLSDPADFVLYARVESAGDVGAQWAVDATASSQFGEDGYSAIQATGEPEIKAAADNPLAWAAKDADGPDEMLELGYAHPVIPMGVRIFESYNPGAVTRLEAQDIDSEEWVVLWEGEEATDEPLRVFSPAFEAPDFRTERIRLTIANDLVAGWNEIDAVQLQGIP